MTVYYILVFNLGDLVAGTSMINDKVKSTDKKTISKAVLWQAWNGSI